MLARLSMCLCTVFFGQVLGVVVGVGDVVSISKLGRLVESGVLCGLLALPGDVPHRLSCARVHHRASPGLASSSAAE
eukprot:5118142-Pyramimonas_sp.AAC.1